MTSLNAASQNASPPRIPATARAEAAAWVARLHSSESRTRGLEAGLQRWLDTDPAHARAFEIATEAWDLGASAAIGGMARVPDAFAAPRARVRSLQRPWLAAAAVFGLLAAGALTYWNRSQSTVATGVGEQRMLTLQDGSRIFLNTDTQLSVKENADIRQVTLEAGEALFDVAQDSRRPFVVRAGDQQIVALGTSFVVRRQAGQLSVTLVEGKVMVDRKTVLEPGQRLTLASRETPRIDTPALENVTAWRRGEVILDKTPLADAIEEMNRYSSVKLVLRDSVPADIRVSGIFRAGDSARFAQALGETYHLQLDHRERQILLGAR